jgi:hypothetical protein
MGNFSIILFDNQDCFDNIKNYRLTDGLLNIF